MDLSDSARTVDRVETESTHADDDVPSGYKRTEVGVIPEDWATPAIHDLSATKSNAIVGGPFGSDLVSRDYASAGVPVVRGQNMSGHYVSGDFVFVTKSKATMLQANLARPDDVVFTQRGTVGQVALIPSGAFDEYLISQSQMKLTLNPSAANSEYVYQYFVSAAGHRQIVDSAIQTGVPHTNLSILRTYQIPLPPTHAERQAIAGALSDADALIESLQQLIAKRRAVKQGAMQALLTGRQRLPGFTSEWQTRSLDGLFTFSGGFSASRDQLGAEGYCYLHYGDIHTTNRTVVDTQVDFATIPKFDVPLNRVSRSSLLDDGDVVFVDASEDEAGTSRHVVVLNGYRRPFISGLHTIVAKPKGNALTHEYCRYCFQTKAVKAQFRFFAVGTKVLGVSKGNIGRIEILVPSLEEQSAIATVLSDMDAEIGVLEARLAKTRALKAGMMQQLLTGRIRLVPANGRMAVAAAASAGQ